MLLPALYHWSPADRRDAIRGEGLRPYSTPTVHSDPDLASPYLCLSTTPSSGWGLSGDMGWVGGIEEWDLWQVRLAEGDEVHYRADFGPVLREIRVYTAIPADRVWFVASRRCPVFEPIRSSRG